MTSWILGDIHGCAKELAALLEHLQPGEDDQLICCGDLFHRGPDPAGVLDLLESAGALFILGNHERTVLQRIGLAPARADASDRAELHTQFPDIDHEDLFGDGDMPCLAPVERRKDLLIFLQRHSGYYLHSSQIEGASTTPDGREWLVVHAGFDPALPLEQNTPFELTRMQRLPRRRRPWWYECYAGPDLVLYGHSTSRIPRARQAGGRLLSLGLDTGCVYGGSLTAYAPELDEFAFVPSSSANAA